MKLQPYIPMKYWSSGMGWMCSYFHLLALSITETTSHKSGWSCFHACSSTAETSSVFLSCRNPCVPLSIQVSNFVSPIYNLLQLQGIWYTTDELWPQWAVILRVMPTWKWLWCWISYKHIWMEKNANDELFSIFFHFSSSLLPFPGDPLKHSRWRVIGSHCSWMLAKVTTTCSVLFIWWWSSWLCHQVSWSLPLWQGLSHNLGGVRG